MAWRATPPSQYEATGARARSPFFTVSITALVALIVGLVGGLALTKQTEPDRVDPAGTKAAAKRAKLVAKADRQLAAVTKIRGAAVLGKERSNVCVTGQHGLTKHGWYDSACGIQVSAYVAVPGTPGSTTRAVRHRLVKQSIPPRADFHRSKSSGPLPKRLRATVTSTTGARGLAAFQRRATLSVPGQDAVYYSKTTTFDLASAYRKHRDGRPVVARISLVAQYAWT